MLTVLSCITVQHDLRLVAIAALLCALGSWVTARLYQYSRLRSWNRLTPWHFLTGTVAGVSIWGTHFVAMLGYLPEAPVELHLGLTALSLVIAIAGSILGLAIAAVCQGRYVAQFGGAILGLSIAGMHYTGMIAYRVQGMVYWDTGYLVASIVLAVVLASAALVAGRKTESRNEYLMALVLTLAIVSLHFTGMAAFTVAPLVISNEFTNPAAFNTLALAVTGTAVLIVVGGFLSYALENRIRLESIAELTAARNAAESASRAKSEFLSVLSHELRTPLTIIMGYAGILSKLGEMQAKTESRDHGTVKHLPSPAVEQAERFGKSISTSASHLLTLINEILDYSGMDLGEAKLEKASFNLRELLDEVVSQFKVMAGEKGITLTVDCDDQITAWADRGRCMQILINLMGNAMKFSHATDVTIRAERLASGFRLDVEDNGRGIHKDDFDRIFMAFQQLETADHRLVGGTGLGLAICKKLAEAHQGDISVESTLGSGTTFTVTLPLSLDKEADMSNAAQAAAA